MAKASNQTVMQTLKSRGVKAPKVTPSPVQPYFDDKLQKSVMDAPYTQRHAY